MVRGPGAKRTGRSGSKVSRKTKLTPGMTRVRKTFQVPVVAERWQEDSTLRQNYKRMGLATDLNKLDKAARDSHSVPDAEVTEFQLPAADLVERVSKRKPMTEAEQKYLRALVVKHGDAYEAMRSDLRLNKQQFTAAHLRRRCQRFLQLRGEELEVEPLPDHL